MTHLVLNNLKKSFGNATAVHELSLSAEKGEFVSLLGPSGCGKTTTLQMIAGFVAPDTGTVLVDGKDITNVPPHKRNLGIVFQHYALFPHMTVAENVAFGLQMRQVSKTEQQRKVHETLDLVRLADFADRYPKQLSGGQQQRVALARALIIQPEVLLLDEPLSALDAKIREQMQIELRSIQKQVGITTILVTHDQAEAMAMSDRIAVMSQGRLAQLDTPQHTYEYPDNSFVSNFLGTTNSFAATAHTQGKATALAATFDCQVATLDAPSGSEITLAIRPEKIQLVAPGSGLLEGTVIHRVFLGSFWMLHVDTPLGKWNIIKQNSGEALPEEGTTTGLHWDNNEIRVIPNSHV